MIERRVSHGFTIVELLVVIVIIAILAAVATVAFGSIVQRSKETAIKTELSTAAKKIEHHKALNSSYPASLSGAGLDVPPSINVQRFVSTGAGFCLVYGIDDKVFSVTEAGSVQEGPCQARLVSTVAGSALRGLNDGSSAVATFTNPTGVTIDHATGIIYVVDANAHAVRKMTPEGTVTTLAGNGTAGTANGTGSAARFNIPRDVAISPVTGDLYVTELGTGSHRIRKVTPSGEVTTFAGSGTAGYLDATGTAAQFNSPVGVVFDADGNLYTAEFGSHRIRKITPSGEVTTLAGTGVAGYSNSTVATSAQFNTPISVAMDKAGNIIVADFGNQRIRKIAPNGTVTTIAGSGVAGGLDGVGEAARFSGPAGVDVDAVGNVYVAEADGGFRVRKINPGGVVTTLGGRGIVGQTNGVGTDALFSRVFDVAVTKTGIVYVVDHSHTNNMIRKIE